MASVDAPEGVGVGLAVEWEPPAEQDVRDHAHSPHVDALAVTPMNHFRREIADRARHRGQGLLGEKPPRHAKVDQLHRRPRIIAREHEVLGLDVPVYHVAGVQVADGGKHLPHIRPHPALVETLGHDLLGEVPPGAQLHDHVHRLAVAINLQEAGDVRVHRLLSDR
eukprot:CAMPEP_0170431042 /NCGR_PEP_ID=MMETSP0117_2-20130122/41185_1 /TAXON_ID=400756 /ORGANISM="Durinskia baltica, Strain CSIRO CS-38" /LENGTH=165 /DNA_ID=CAMNT_0010690561 /DNA_START=51 /DNA_END=548 /DNA_ORIENTATION=-